MTKGETLFLILAIATFVSFGLMLAYHDYQYRQTRRGGQPAISSNTGRQLPGLAASAR